MANMTEVQMAFKKGDKAKATQLLKIVLHEHPSADAWVMAARLTSNPETAKLHLQRALAFEPKHIKARDMLRDLGGTPMSTSAALTGGLVSTLQAELEKFGANKPILRNFAPRQRMITAISLYAVVITLMLVMISALLTPPDVPPLPTPTVYTVYEGDTLVSQWNTSGIKISDLVKVAKTPEMLPKEQIDFTITDDKGPQKVNVLLYNDVASIVNDRLRLKKISEDSKVKLDFIQTAVIIYPADMDAATVSLLESVLYPTPATPV